VKNGQTHALGAVARKNGKFVSIKATAKTTSNTMFDLSKKQ